MKLGKKSWLLILMVIVMCVSTLGGTFAWFTDEVTTTGNIVQSGNLDAKMQWADGKKNPSSVSWQNAAQGAIFDYDLWEPGYAQVRHLRIENAGDLAFKYQLSIAAGSEVSALSDVIDVYCITPATQVTSRTDLTDENRIGTLTEVLSGLRLMGGDSYLLSGEKTTVTIALKMQEEAGNEYQNLSIGSDFAVQLLATQYAYEEDSFGKDYDAKATFGANFKFFSTSADAPKVDGNGRTVDDVTLGDAADPVAANVPEGVKLEEGTEKLTLQVERGVGMSANVPVAYDEAAYSLDVHIDGVSKDNREPITVYLRGILPAGLYDSSVALFHVEGGEAKKMKSVSSFTAHNQYKYDPATGDVTLYVASFSDFIARVAADNPWNGDVKTEWYTKNPSASVFYIENEEDLAGLGQLVAEGNDFAGKTIKLTANLDLGGETSDYVFYPIGYSSDNPSEVKPFKGTFDGQGHAIDDLYQNTWNIKGNYDNGYYNKSLGLFALLDGATVKNLVLDHFVLEGEFAPVGCLAGRAKGGTFENIQVFSSNPATYNNSAAALIGDDVSDGANYNFTNITVDSSNTISALWGTYDAACGGIMGYLNESSKANFTNCEIGAVMDVYNDVCGNYQYYEYRYCGMLVGTVGDDGNPDSSRIHCTNCNVYLGNWRNNYYCEFVENSQASYTDDYQFSRVSVSELIFTDGKVTGCVHEHKAEEDKTAVYLPFSQLYTGYGWGANAVYSHDGVNVQEYVYSVTYMDGADDVLGVDYVSNNGTAYRINHTVTKQNMTFSHWVNASSNKVTSVAAGNVDNVRLYASWAGKFVARFVDQDGNIVYECVFTQGQDFNQIVPDPPRIDEFVGTWEENYQTKIKNAKADVTIRPVYTYNGALKLTPVDEDGDGDIEYYRVEATENLSGTVNIPGNVNKIPVRDIEKLSKEWWGNVTGIVVNEGTETISKEAFSGTPNLKTVTLPHSLKSIESNAFSSNVLGLANKKIEITYNGTKQEWDAIIKDSGWQDGMADNSKIICEDGYYILTRNWSRYTWNWVPN